MAGPPPRRPRPLRSAANQRSLARLAAVQALYQMDVGGASLSETLEQFVSHRLGQELEGEHYLPADADYFRAIVAGVVKRQIEIDPLVNAALSEGWTLGRLDKTLCAILRAGAFELCFRGDVPARVAIVEYVDVARAFFSGDEPKLVNAVLDRLAHAKRSDEFEAEPER
jgi:N utilization substance protein B